MAGHTFVANEVATAANLNSLLPPIVTQTGAVKLTPIANTPTSVRVTFATPFASAPVVTATAATTVFGDTVKGVAVSDVTATGFTVWAYRTNTATTTVLWQAWGPQGGIFVDSQPAYKSLLDAISSSPISTQIGVKSITPTAGSASSGSVTFPTPFASTPSVIVCATSASVGVVWGAAATGISTTGFTAWVWRSNGTTTGVNWIAIGRM